MQSQVCFVPSSRLADVSGSPLYFRRMYSVIDAKCDDGLVAGGLGAQADVCVDDRRLEEGLFGVWEALSAFD